MSLDKAIEHGKEKRKPYGDSNKAFAKACRNHGSCPVCGGNRLYQRCKCEEAAKQAEEEYEDDAE